MCIVRYVKQQNNKLRLIITITKAATVFRTESNNDCQWKEKLITLLELESQMTVGQIKTVFSVGTMIMFTDPTTPPIAPWSPKSLERFLFPFLW